MEKKRLAVVTFILGLTGLAAVCSTARAADENELNFVMALLPKRALDNITEVNKITFGSMVSYLARLLTIAAGTMFFFLILVSGFRVVFSANKQEAFQSVRKNLTTGVIGLVAVFAAYWIAAILYQITGSSSMFGTS